MVIRLGSSFNNITFDGNKIIAGASALDSKVALRAADEGLDLTFLRTIPGSIGSGKDERGFVMDHTLKIFVSAKIVNRSGELIELSSKDIQFSYRCAVA